MEVIEILWRLYSKVLFLSDDLSLISLPSHGCSFVDTVCERVYYPACYGKENLRKNTTLVLLF